MKLPIGFRYGAAAAGLKATRTDVALIYSPTPCVAAGVFTTNKAKAAPVADAEARLPGTRFHGVVVNSGNANSLTGASGIEAVAQIHAAVARELGVEVSSILSASTGIIGIKLPVAKILAAVPRLVTSLGAEPEGAADAMMTTDTVRKLSSRTVQLPGVDQPVTIAALAKGSGMIAPQLATVIAVVATDAAISPDALRAALVAGAAETFNHLTIDGDTSTNDAVLALANGQAKNPLIADTASPSFHAFAAAIFDLFRELARAIAADGEGATKRVEVRVAGAPDAAVAADLARAVAGSTLVKAAIFGADPNWGRILATVGARAGSQRFDINPYRAAVSIQHVAVYDGGPIEFDRTQLRAKMREPEILIEVDTRGGDACATAWGCDLSYDYVKINADYSSLIVEKADGAVAKDDRFANYSPKFKVSLLVQALSYISRFRGQRCVIACGGAALTTESLKRAFCDDVLLLRSVGLLPVVVHGGGPELDRARDRHGEDEKVIEMVLTGSVNSELVSLLNRAGGSAVGLSGKDGAMLRATKGELVATDVTLVDLMLGKGYVPVISPIGLGDDGQSYVLDADDVAAGVAVALHAEKLLYLADAPGILANGDLVSELGRTSLGAMIEAGSVAGGMAVKSRSVLRALDGGVKAVHLLDGRTPHSAIAELFTDSGVGTVVR